jgi:superfamily II DNA or RNA helicase
VAQVGESQLAYQWPERFWPLQTVGCQSVVDAIAAGVRRMVLTAPTGTGKTKIMLALIEWAAENRMPSTLYTNRRMLCDQTAKVLDDHGIDYGLRAAGHKPALLRDVQLAMTPTEYSAVVRKQSRAIHHSGLVLCDELHMQGGGMLAELLDLHYLDGAAICGVTATPIDLEGDWEQLIIAGRVSDGRSCGALIPAYTYCPDTPDLKHIKQYKVGEDLTDKENHSAIMRPGVFGRIWEHWKRLNPDGKPTILFGPDVAGSIYFAQEFHKHGVPAAHIDAKQIWINGEYIESTDENRQDIVAKSESGEITVVCNRFVLREGINMPHLAHAIFACVFGSLKSYVQAGGRVLRAHPSLTEVCVQDHGGNYCLDSQTEVLTPRGWMGPDSIRDDDTVAGYDLQTGSISWQPIQQRIDRPLEPGETMYEAHGKFCDMRVTGNHRLAFKKRTCTPSNNPVWPDRFVLARADELAQSFSRFKIPVSGHQAATGVSLTDDELRFLGWFITDGHRSKFTTRDRDVVIAQSNHQPQITDLRECLAGCGFDVREHAIAGHSGRFSAKPSTHFCIPKGTCKSRPRNGWYRLKDYIDKDLSSLLDEMDERQFAIFLHAVYLGDGFKRRQSPGSYQICTGNRLFADRLQSLCVRRGFRCNITTRLPNGKTNQKNPLYIFHIQKSSHLILHGLHAAIGQTRLALSPSEVGERVWCVANPLGTLVTRRNGKVAIVGNCRHGSLNADRDWELGMRGYRVTGLRQDAMREKPELEPIICPKCGMGRLSGPTCPKCGYSSHKRARTVVQISGDLKLQEGPSFRPRHVKMTPDTGRIWTACYHRARSKKWDATFNQAEALFFRENFFYPPRTLPLMPKEPGDWYEKVANVPRDRLIQKEATPEE